MIFKSNKNKLRLKRHKCIRGKTSDTAGRPRLSVFHSDKNIYVRLADDVEGVALASASANDKNISAEGSKVEWATEVGKVLTETTAKKNIKSAVFDRNDHLYHGRVQVLADAACENGLEFQERRIN